ncbi:ABC transporter permease [Nitratireductor sp. GISD-1A_MAKvit]|uniref:ABC transporter permease n=1 Tax=Nitratireductor sp. GISD-1A_MAKvit TaxID=3234198 RepID=UPI0034653299
MRGYLLNRLLQSVLVVLGVTTVVFLVTRVFGDPVSLMLPLSASAEQKAAFAQQIGLDKPLLTQFIHFAGDLVTLDFGESLWQRRPVVEVIADRLPNSLLLVSVALVSATLLAIPLGTIAALRPDGFLDKTIVGAGLLGLSMPQFWVGLLLIVVFSVNLKLLPTSGMATPAHIILPAITLALTPLARQTMLIRSSMIDELNKQYVKTARAKGMPFGRVLGAHALRNTWIPFLTLAGWEFVLTLAGYSVVVETVFSWPGLGLTAIQAIQRGDLFLVQGVVFTIAVLIVVVNVVLDIVFRMIDPRIRLG